MHAEDQHLLLESDLVDDGGVSVEHGYSFAGTSEKVGSHTCYLDSSITHTFT